MRRTREEGPDHTQVQTAELEQLGETVLARLSYGRWGGHPPQCHRITGLGKTGGPGSKRGLAET